MRLSRHSDSGSDLEAEDARRNWRINAYNGFDEARDKARDKVKSHENPEAPFLRIAQKTALKRGFRDLTGTETKPILAIVLLKEAIVEVGSITLLAGTR